MEVEEAEVVQAIGDDEKAPLRSILFQRLALVCVENERKFESPEWRIVGGNKNRVYGYVR